MQTPPRFTALLRSLKLSLVVIPALLCLLRPAHAAAQALADFNVNSVADKVDAKPGDGVCSTGATIDGHTAECTLRAAIDEVNALSITNPSRVYVVSVMSGTYSLATDETCIYHDAGNPNALSTTTAVLCVSGNITLNGTDPTTTIVDHALVDRDFFVSAGYTVSINNMTIQNGGQYGGSFDGAGGGINNQGSLTLSNDTFFKNYSQIGGAGVYNGGTLVVEGCTFLANSGPGLEANYSVTSIDNSYFTQNTAGNASAVSTYLGTLHISNSTASGNIVGSNGIIAMYGTAATITNSTISDNTVGNAGAVVSSGLGSSLTLNNDTISGNTAGNIVGGLFASPVTMSNTIIAGNSGYDCAVDTLTDLGHNLIQNPDPNDCQSIGSTTLTGVDAKLGTVALDGGSIPTQGPLPGSPAIGAGSPATPGSNAAGACTAIDERGFVRGRSGACTIGAVEPLGGLQINNVSPDVGSPGGTARMVVHGSGFVPGSTLALSGGGQSVPLLQTTVAPDTFSVAALLDLSKAPLGAYDIMVTTPTGASTTLPGGYKVEKATAPVLYSYVYGPGVARAGRPDFYSIVYGNKGNADAYLVPVTLAIPGNFAGLISSPVLNPPAANGQVIQDWTSVPVQVTPYTTAGFTNVPLIIPVIPAGFSGVIQFSITPPPGTPEDTPYALDASLGNPYSTALSGAVDPAILADFVTGAQNYAQTDLGVTLTASELAGMSTYASAQLAQEVSLGGQALLVSAGGSPVLFSNSQLLIDIATYGASLAPAGSDIARSSRKTVRPFSVNAGFPATPASPVSNSCSGGTTLPGPSCVPIAIPIPTPISGSFTVADCKSLPNHSVSPNGTLCLVTSTLQPISTPGTLVGSVDPNEKDGPLGIGAAHFTLADDPFHYQIEFENTPTASAPAQMVSVTDPLNVAQYDLSTFELGPISFGPYVLTPPPGLTSYAGALDLRPTENVIVTVRASLDANTGVASWNFASLDPSTMQLVTDPTAGFLPPDTNPPAGIGHVTFSVQPLASVASGTNICNTASVVFDTNAAISTAPFCNSKDTTAPVSSVKPLSATETAPTFTVSWSGTDAGVGLATYTIYVSVDGGLFSTWQTATASTSASYPGSVGHTYGFYSIATDLLGNTEAPKTSVEATTTVTNATPPIAQFSLGFQAFPDVAFGSTVAPPVELLTVKNIGGGTLTFTTAFSARNFAVLATAQNTCLAGVIGGQSCTLPVEFIPAGVGLHTNTLTLTPTSGTGASITLRGLATGVGDLSEGSLNFGSIPYGTTETLPLTVENFGLPGTPTLNVTISNSNYKVLPASTCLAAGLAAGKTCTLQIEFNPTAVGVQNTHLIITPSSGAASTVYLNGTATAP